MKLKFGAFQLQVGRRRAKAEATEDAPKHPAAKVRMHALAKCITVADGTSILKHRMPEAIFCLKRHVQDFVHG